MNMAKFSSLIVAMMVITGTLIFSGLLVSAQCKGDPQELIFQCSRFVTIEGPKLPPSPDCCSAVKNADIPCLCRIIPPEIEKIVSIEKAVYVARTCGITVKPGTKCGSYTVPPAAPLM